MKQYLLKISWFLIFVSTFVFWYFIYESSVSEYDTNFVYLIFAIICSVFTLCVWICTVYKDNSKTKIKRLLKLFVLFFGTPITLFFLWIYFSFFYMKLICLTGSYKYEMKKFQNYFKARNELVIKEENFKSDTLVSIILRDNSIDKIYRICNGKAIDLTINDLKFMSNSEKKGFTTY